ncbi:MAG: HypC/HybG/HupF family hydrogenase formation chaperone [Verrucomicrobiota bacterium]|nr:HypC/HybG/HupF family hydrogenase formation chaperone [Verrucomicrobiota bacterium]
MCLAVPAKIVELTGQDAVVEADGVRRRCNVTFVHEPRLGDHVLVHAGFAIQKWSEEDVREYDAIMRSINAGGPAQP